MNYKNVTVSGSEKISLISNMSTMLSAGIPILDVVTSLLEDSKGGQKKILEALRQDLMEGKHVYESFARFPQVFDSVTVNVLKASEEAGTLDITLKDLKQNILKEMEFTDKVRFALLYPFFIVLVFFGVLMMILIVVVPKISTVFSNMHVKLPLPTRVLIFLSDTVLKQTIPLLCIVAGVVFGIYFLYKKRKSFLLEILFKFPVVSTLVKEIDLTRFSRSLYLLLYSGLPITGALELAQEVVHRKDMALIIKKTRELVLSGKTVSEGLRLSKGYIPTIMIKLIEAGEKTGTLDKSMQDISDYFDYQVSNTLKTLTALLEPVMLVLVGIVVGGMMLAIIAPIYGLVGQVGNR